MCSQLSKKLVKQVTMSKILLSVFAVFAVIVISGEISSNSDAADSCLACHGSADQLKTMINDEDFNKPQGEGGYG